MLQIHLIEVEKFCLDFPVFVVKIEDDCILGVDFLEQVKLGGIFIYGEELENGENFLRSRISREDERILQNLLELYLKNSRQFLTLHKRSLLT